jgi:hypothetical protein
MSRVPIEQGRVLDHPGRETTSDFEETPMPRCRTLVPLVLLLALAATLPAAAEITSSQSKPRAEGWAGVGVESVAILETTWNWLNDILGLSGDGGGEAVQPSSQSTDPQNDSDSRGTMDPDGGH